MSQWRCLAVVFPRYLVAISSKTNQSKSIDLRNLCRNQNRDPSSTVGLIEIAKIQVISEIEPFFGLF